MTALSDVLAATGTCARSAYTINVQPWGERSFCCRDPFGSAPCFVDDTTLFTGKGANE